jgi:hypothetical protein
METGDVGAAAPELIDDSQFAQQRCRQGAVVSISRSTRIFHVLSFDFGLFGYGVRGTRLQGRDLMQQEPDGKLSSIEEVAS